MAELTVRLDTSASPALAAWGPRAAQAATTWWPRILGALGQAPYDKEVRLVVRPEVGPPAYCTGSEIHCDEAWFTAHPDDLGAVVHEAVHAAQCYPSYEPGWLVEGIADYVRYCVMEPESRWATADLSTASWTNGYGPCGVFLGWLVTTYESSLVHRLDAALRSGRYADQIVVDACGASWAELWPLFLADREAAAADRVAVG